MAKVGRPGIDGTEVLVKIQRELLAQVDEVWPKTECTSRNEFIRKSLWEEVNRAKRGLGVPAQ